MCQFYWQFCGHTTWNLYIIYAFTVSKLSFFINDLFSDTFNSFSVAALFLILLSDQLLCF